MSEELEDQSFDDAFDEFAGEDTNAELQEEVHEAEEEIAPEAEEPPEEQPRDDRGRFTSTDEKPAEPDWKAEAQQWQHRYNSDLGRQSALQRKIQEQQVEIARLQRSTQSAPQQPQANPNGMTDAKWKEFKEDFPEIAEVMEHQQQLQAQAHQREIAQLREQLVPIQQQSHKQYINAQYQILDQQHPDWRDVAQSKEFRQWVSTQPAPVQQLVNSDEAADAAYLVQTYKTSVGSGPSSTDELKQRRERQLRQGQTLTNRGGRSRTNLPAEDDFEAAFDYFASKG